MPAIAVSGLFMLVQADAKAEVINFDDVANGTIIDTQYPGVTFGCVSCSSGHAFARDMAAFGSSTAASGLNVVTLVAPAGSGLPGASSLTSFNTPLGALSATFATPQRTVSVDARPQLPLEFLGAVNNKPYMELYSSTVQNASTLIARVLYPLNFGDPGYCSPNVSACGGVWQTLTFTSASDNIVSIRLSSQNSQGGAPVYADFDNLAFQTSPPPGMELRAFFANDFQSGAPSGMTLFGQAKVEAGYLKLQPLAGDSYGVTYIDDFNGGQQVFSFQAAFKASLFGSTCCAGGFFPADGFSFNLVPAGTVRSNPGYNEPAEEGLDEGLAINFDTWDNGEGEGPAIEVKWLGAVVARTPFQSSQSPLGITDPVAASKQVFINLDSDGTIDVSYGGTLVIDNVQTPYRPGVIGVPKWVFGSRSGLANDQTWIDDLRIDVIAGPQQCFGFNTRAGALQGLSLFGEARVEDGYLKLVSVPGSVGFGIAHIEDFGGGRLVEGFHATFTAALFGSTCCGGGIFPADGFSFNLVPATTLRSNPIYNEPGEEGLEEGLAVNFDTWDNGGGEAPAIEVKWRGQIIGSAAFQSSQSPAGATTDAQSARDVSIRLKPDGRIDVSYGGVAVISNLQTPYSSAAIGTPAWVFGARIGGANDNHWIDNLCIATQTSQRRLIPGLFATGVNDQGVPLPEDETDQHYRILQSRFNPFFRAFATTSAGGFPVPPWLADNRFSAWISPSIDTVAFGGGDFVYETRFDLTGLDPATARIAGRWAADNFGTAIELNGNSIPVPTQPDFVTWQPFQIANGFVAGTNILRFVVNNQFDLSTPDGSNSTGLRVEAWGTAAMVCGGPRPPASLYIAGEAGRVRLVWDQPGFVLQSAAAVTGPWIDRTRGVNVNGREHFVILPATGSARFFRLRLDCE